LSRVQKLDLGLERLVDLSGIQQWCPSVKVSKEGGDVQERGS